jgi:hypothetical protein
MSSGNKLRCSLDGAHPRAFLAQNSASTSPREPHPSKSIRTVRSSVPNNRTAAAFDLLLGT